MVYPNRDHGTYNLLVPARLTQLQLNFTGMVLGLELQLYVGPNCSLHLCKLPLVHFMFKMLLHWLQHLQVPKGPST